MGSGEGNEREESIGIGTTRSMGIIAALINLSPGPRDRSHLAFSQVRWGVTGRVGWAQETLM